jgi:hypothetical protein
LQGDVEEAGPLSREIEMQDALDHLQKLLANGAMGGSQNRQDAVTKSLLLIFG